MRQYLFVLLFGMLPTFLIAQNPKGGFSITPMVGINVTGLGGATIDAYHNKVRARGQSHDFQRLRKTLTSKTPFPAP